MSNEIIENNTNTQEAEIITVNEPKSKPLEITIWNNTELFNQTYTMAKILAQAEIVPQQYRGKVGDCLIAIDMANRMGLAPLVVMQSSQVVRGNFSWKGTACKAMIDGCGKYKSTRYVEVGTRGKDDWGFYLEAIDNDGNVIVGVTVDIAMAKAEGWYNKDGSKWKTMPELMLKYRASAFFMRTECAGLAMGFLTVEENEDIEQNDKNNLSNMLDEEME